MHKIIEIVFWTLLMLTFHTYVAYYLILLLWSKQASLKRKRDTKRLPSVSFVIAAFNENKTIADKIKNSLAIRYPKNRIEFIFGSDHSTDGTDITISRYGKKHKNIKLYAFGKREGKANVLNKIVPRAKGEILIFSDANTMYNPDAVGKMVSHFADPKIGGVCGKLILVNPGHGSGGSGESLYWNYENKLKKLEGKIKTVFGATGGIYAIRKRLFQKLPKHQTNISDDFLIPMKIVQQGFDVVYEENAIAREYACSTMRDEFLRKVRIGAANAFAVRKIWPMLHPRKGFIAFGLWSHKIIRWAVPFFMILIFLTNLGLLKNRFYLLFFILQILMYLVAGIGWFCDRNRLNIKLVSLSYYFVSINLALLIGYYRFATGTIKPTWARLKR